MAEHTHLQVAIEPRGRMISQLAEALEPEVPVAAHRQQEDSSSSTGPLGHQNFAFGLACIAIGCPVLPQTVFLPDQVHT